VQFNCLKNCTKNWTEYLSNSLSELRSSLCERRLGRTVLRPALLPVKTAQFTQFFRQVWHHTVKSLSLTESLNGVITLCIDSNTNLLYIYILYIHIYILYICIYSTSIPSNTTMCKDMVYSYMFRLVKSSSGWVENHESFGIPNARSHSVKFHGSWLSLMMTLQVETCSCNPYPYLYLCLTELMYYVYI
jgi:hypothetical protein